MMVAMPADFYQLTISEKKLKLGERHDLEADRNYPVSDPSLMYRFYHSFDHKMIRRPARTMNPSPFPRRAACCHVQEEGRWVK
jgi:hypothetical protein